MWSHPKSHLQLVVSQEQTCHLREREEEVRSQEQHPKGAKGTSQVEARPHAGLPNKACPLALVPPQAAAVQIEEMVEGGRPDTPVMAVGMLTQSCHLPSFPVMLGPGGLQLQRHVMASESCLLGGSLREKTEASGCPLSPRNPPEPESCGPAAHTGSPPVGEAASGGAAPQGWGPTAHWDIWGVFPDAFSSSPTLLGALGMFLGPYQPPHTP